MFAWMKKIDKSFASLVAVVGFLASWSAVEAWLDSKALSEEEFQQYQEKSEQENEQRWDQQGMVDALQEGRGDQFEMELIDRRMLDLYAASDRALSDVKNFPDDFEYKRVLRRAELAIQKAEGRLCQLMKRNGMRCARDDDE